jgi:hypothetical protein
LTLYRYYIADTYFISWDWLHFQRHWMMTVDTLYIFMSLHTVIAYRKSTEHNSRNEEYRETIVATVNTLILIRWLARIMRYLYIIDYHYYSLLRHYAISEILTLLLLIIFIIFIIDIAQISLMTFSTFRHYAIDYFDISLLTLHFDIDAISLRHWHYIDISFLSFDWRH